MNCDHVQSCFADFETLTPDESKTVREHLESCEMCRHEWREMEEFLTKLDTLPKEEPSSRLKMEFYAKLAQATSKRGYSRFFGVPTKLPGGGPWHFNHVLIRGLAAALLVAAGAWGGIAFHPDHRDEADRLALIETQRQLAELRTKIDSVDQWVAFSLAQRQPAQTRLQQVVSRSVRNDSAAVARLLGTVEFDPNTNVRLSALEALYLHASDLVVKDSILNALPRESSPLVQLAMINFLTSVRDRQAGPIFEDLVRTPRVHEAVRTAAQRALSQL
jgi:hypothetical protein